MIIFKKRGDYLEKRAKVYLFLSIGCIATFALNLFIYTYYAYHQALAQLWVNLVLLLLSLFVLVGGIRCFRTYLNYNHGLEGERQVTNSLLSSLNNQYYLMDDVKFSDGKGNIDHIVLGPNGIFAIETKNFSGEITCYGDKWSRRYKGGLRYDLGSPSKQVKRNAIRIKEIIESSGIFKESKIWVQGVVVFTSRDVKLTVTNCTEPCPKILGVNELTSYIMTEHIRHFSRQELELVCEEILKQAC